jgi:hypothetical protein
VKAGLKGMRVIENQRMMSSMHQMGWNYHLISMISRLEVLLCDHMPIEINLYSLLFVQMWHWLHSISDFKGIGSRDLEQEFGLRAI